VPGIGIGSLIPVTQRAKQPITKRRVELLIADFADRARGDPHLFNVLHAAGTSAQVLVDTCPRLRIEFAVEIRRDQFDQRMQRNVASPLRAACF